jgi:AraC family transcriptional regulator
MSGVVYIKSQPYISETIRIKNMVCDCCLIMAKNLLESNQIVVETIELGEATIIYDHEKTDLSDIDRILATVGLGIIKNRDEIIVDKLKQAVFDLIHRMNNVNSIVQKSDYLVEKMGVSYQQLSKHFSRYHSITLEKYIILNKIERIKELIDQGEFSLSEIAYMMDYSSVHYLSTQFKKYTGYSVSDYKSGVGKKMPVNRIGEK